MSFQSFQSSYPIGALGAHIVLKLAQLVVYRIYQSWRSSYNLGAVGAYIISELSELMFYWRALQLMDGRLVI